MTKNLLQILEEDDEIANEMKALEERYSELEKRRRQLFLQSRDEIKRMGLKPSASGLAFVQIDNFPIIIVDVVRSDEVDCDRPQLRRMTLVTQEGPDTPF